MQNKFKHLFLSLTVVILTYTASAQTQNFKDTKIDSITFVQTKAKLNNLPTDQFKKQIYKQKESQLPFRFLLPKNFNRAKKYPLVITLHNSTRIGNDNENQLEPLAKIWIREEIYDNYNCFVVAPQFNERSSNYIENENGILVSKPSTAVDLVLGLLKNLEKEYPNIDKSRIYLVGYSMGASTAQNILNKVPKLIAGMVSIAAVPDLSNLDAIKNKNIWLIHGEQDIENPYKGSVELFEKLKNNKKIIFTTYSALNHNNINMPLLLSKEIPEWLFNQNN